MRMCVSMLPAAVMCSLLLLVPPGFAADGASEVRATADRDCAIDSFSSQDHPCTVEELRVSDWTTDASFQERVLLHFPTPALPPGHKVLSASIYLHGGPADQAVYAYRVTSDWTNDADWGRRDQTQTWATIDSGDPDRRSPFPVVQAESEGWSRVDISRMVESWVTGARRNQGAILIADERSTQGDSALFDSIEAGSAVAPYLVVRHGRDDVVGAAEWTGDPSSGGQLLAREWTVLASNTARREVSDTITTRTSVLCDPADQEGPRCAEARWRTLDSQLEGAGADDLDTFARHRGASELDSNIPQITDILDGVGFAEAGLSPIATGALTAVMQPWQVPPPGHGNTYELYEVNGSLAHNAGSYDESTGEFPSGVATTAAIGRVWVDSATSLPIRQVVNTNGVDTTSYWSYDPVPRPRDEFPADFFLVSEPDDAGLLQSVTFDGPRPAAVINDSHGSRLFAGSGLGPRATLRGRRLCLAKSNVFRQTENLTSDGTTPDLGPAHHDLSSLTRHDVIYRSQRSPWSCPADDGHVEQDDLVISSTGRGSALANAYRAAIVPRAKALDVSPRVGAAFGSRVGSSTPPLTRSSAAYVAPADGGGTVLLAELGDTTILLRGRFSAEDARSLIANLRAA